MKKFLHLLFILMLVQQTAAAAILTSDEIEADVADRIAEVVRLTPAVAALKHAAEGNFYLFAPPADVVDSSKVSGASCGYHDGFGMECSQKCVVSKQRGPVLYSDSKPTLTTYRLIAYNYYLLAMPQSPFAWRCKATVEDVYAKVEADLIEKLHVTSEEYAKARAENIARYRILEIAAAGDMQALKIYKGELQVTDALGYGPLEYARHNKHEDMVQALLATGKVKWREEK